MRHLRGSSVALGAGLTGVAIMIAIAVVSNSSRDIPGTSVGQSYQKAGEVAGTTGTYSTPQAIQRWKPEAQQGVDASKVTRTVEIEASSTVPTFNVSRIRVKPGDVISLTFRNNSATNHQYNWVLVQPGKERKVGMAGAQAGPDNGFIPVLPDDIIAHTGLLNPGDSDTIVFRAPSKTGDYPYISSLPGYWEAMRGVLEVTAPS